MRLRLALWYSVMFATAALLLSLTSWWMLRHAIEATTRQDLQERIDDVREQLVQFGPRLNKADTQERFDAIYRHRDDGKWLQIADGSGNWMYRSARMISLHRTDEDLTQGTPLKPFSQFDQGSRHVRTFRLQIQVDGHTYRVETGIAMNKQLMLLRRFGFSLLLLTPAVFAAAIFVGYWMSRKALSPVAAIANEARRISERNLDRRLPVSTAEDEVAHLSVTLNNMLGRIDAGFRSVRDFTANASHELRTPLALLRTEAEIALLSPRSPQEYRETLQYVQVAATDMSIMIERLLTLARAEAGTVSLRLSEVDLLALVESVYEEWRPVAVGFGIDLRLAIETDKPMIVAGDRLALLQLLRICLDNACKCTPSGGRIVLFGEATDGRVLMGVRDSGVGIPKLEQERIFERFYRSKRDQGSQGAGLGLSLAARIAEQHGSRISVVSAPAEGSTFSLSLRAVANESGGKSQDRFGMSPANFTGVVEGKHRPRASNPMEQPLAP